MVRVRDPLGLPLAGLTLGRPTVQLDENRQLLAVSDAELACPLTLGEMRYPAGTQVKTAGYPLRQRFPSQSWVFSPVAPGQATRAGQSQPVNDGTAVVQAPGGAVLGLLSNEEAGVPLRADHRQRDGSAGTTGALPLMRGRRDVRARPTGT